MERNEVFDLKNWHIDFDLDWNRWALPVGVSIYSFTSWRIQFLCFVISFCIYGNTEISPEEELQQLNEYADEQMRFIAEEREEIMKKLGVTTR